MPERFSVEVINARRLFRVIRTLLRLERRDKRFSKTLLVPSFSTRYQVFFWESSQSLAEPDCLMNLTPVFQMLVLQCREINQLPSFDSLHRISRLSLILECVAVADRSHQLDESLS